MSGWSNAANHCPSINFVGAIHSKYHTKSAYDSKRVEKLDFEYIFNTESLRDSTKSSTVLVEYVSGSENMGSVLATLLIVDNAISL